MNSDEITIKNYLDELCRMTGADTDSKVSMHEVGSVLGLEKVESGKIAEELMVQGLVELKTLAGGIGITDKGLEHLGIASSVTATPPSSLQLSGELVVTESDRATIKQLTATIKDETTGLDLEYQHLEGIILDLKCIDLHLLSPRPKNSVLRELLGSIENTLTVAGSATSPAAESIKSLI